MESKVPVLQLNNITKRFGNITANENISLDVYQGEILALLGENGSGKTTLMNMISGIYFPDEGSICVKGKNVSIASPKDAFDLGIGMIHQHFKLVDVLTAVENIALGLEGKLMLDKREVAAKVREICDKYGFDVDPNQKVYNMSVSQKQTVEIVKVLYRKADILILDEPTRGIDVKAKSEFYALMNEFVAQGGTVIMVSSELPEIIGISDRILVMREGRITGELGWEGVTEEQIISLASLIIALIIGGILGAIAGYFGGVVDSVIMRLMDILMSIPSIRMAESKYPLPLFIGSKSRLSRWAKTEYPRTIIFLSNIGINVASISSPPNPFSFVEVPQRLKHLYPPSFYHYPKVRARKRICREIIPV